MSQFKGPGISQNRLKLNGRFETFGSEHEYWLSNCGMLVGKIDSQEKVMRSMIKRSEIPILICLFCLLITGPLDAEEKSEQQRFEESVKRAEKMAQSVLIHRDSYSVPHVYGPTDASVVFGFTYARAEDEFQKIQRSLLSASGRLSELMGAPAFLTDRAMRLFEIPAHSQREYETCDENFRKMLIAYADALNYYVYKHPGTDPVVIKCFEPWHALAAGRTMNISMLSFSPEYPELLKASQQANPTQSSLQQPRPVDERDGSNMWALGPSRTQSGNAMLFINPHIPLNQLYEGHLHSEEGLHITGGFAYGSFMFPFAGHNENLGWSLTVNYPDVIDVFVEAFEHPEDANKYRIDEKWKSVERWEDEILIKQADGELKPTKLDCEKTIHGPVFFRVGKKGYSVAASKVAQGGFPQQLYAMAKAGNLAEFKSAVGRCSLAFHNVMYADVEGNTWYVYNSATPKRDPSIEWHKLVDGSNGKAKWNGYHTLAELPQVLNPDCGWMQNCNSSPYSTSLDGQNPARDDFPNYIGRNDADNNRVKISKSILGREKKFSFEDLEAAAWDTRALEADQWVPFLEKALKNSDSSGDEKLRKVVATLTQWDRHVKVDSVAATLFHLWYEKAGSSIRQSKLTPDDSISHLLTVVGDLERDFSNWEIAYGELFRHQRPDADGKFAGDEGESFPIAGGHPQVGMVFTFLSRKVSGSKKRYGFHGHSYVSVIKYDKEGVKSKSLVPYGQSGNPESKHYLDQAPLYAAGKFKNSLFTQDEVKQNSKRNYHPGE